MWILSCLEVKDQTRVPQDPHVVQLSLHPRFHGVLPHDLTMLLIELSRAALMWTVHERSVDKVEPLIQAKSKSS
jgi:hypothetical protein